MDTTKYNETESLLDNESLEDMIRFNRAKNLFLRDDSDDFEDAEVFYPSKMNEESPNVIVDKEVETKNLVQPFLMPVSSRNEVQIVDSNPPNLLV